jgi:hypothetical protein
MPGWVGWVREDDWRWWNGHKDDPPPTDDEERENRMGSTSIGAVRSRGS